MQPCGVGMDGHDPRTSKGINVAQGPDVSHVPNGTGRGEGSGDWQGSRAFLCPHTNDPNAAEH